MEFQVMCYFHNFVLSFFSSSKGMSKLREQRGAERVTDGAPLGVVGQDAKLTGPKTNGMAYTFPVGLMSPLKNT